jgi:hypothetical protein
VQQYLFKEGMRVVSSEEVSRRVLETQSSDLEALVMALTGTQEAVTKSSSREKGAKQARL